MAQEWHYEQNGERQGPITSQKLKQLAASGQLQPTDLIWKDGMAEWKPAKSIKGLFQATGQLKATEPPPVTGQSKPTTTAPSQNDSAGIPADQPGLLKRAKTKFSSLPTPQKVIYGVLGGMGVCFFLCMGMCGLAGLFGSFLPDDPEVARDVPEVVAPPNSIQGRWWSSSDGANATVLIVDGNTFREINPFTGETTVTEYTVKNDTDPKQIDFTKPGDLEARTRRSARNPNDVLYVLPKHTYGIYKIEEKDVGAPLFGDTGPVIVHFLTIRQELKGLKQYRPSNFTDRLNNKDPSMIKLKSYVHERVWTWGDPPSKYKTREEQ